MRAIWSGEISFGLVTIPTKLYPASRDLTPAFHWIHKVCGTRVQAVRRCPHCDRDISWNEIQRGYEVSKGKYARFSKEELAAAESDEPKGIIEIVAFVTQGEVDPAYLEKSYWVGASGKSSSSFNLLRTVLEKSRRVGLTKVAIRERTRLALLRPRDGLFSLDMMRYADELVPPTDVDAKPGKAPSDKELRLAKTLVDQLTERFHPSKHPDEYRVRVNALVDEKLKHREGKGLEEVGTARRAPKTDDLSGMLARSIAATRHPTRMNGRGTHPRPAVHRAPRVSPGHPTRRHAS